MGELALEEALYNQVCFHAHQAAEKALKALIAYGGSNPPRTHSLTELLTAGEKLEPALAGSGEGLDSVETLYIPARYPDAPPGSLPEGLPRREDAREALATAQEVSDLVRQKVEEDGWPPDENSGRRKATDLTFYALNLFDLAKNDSYLEYSRRSPAAVAKHDGRVVALGLLDEALESEPEVEPRTAMILVEWASRESFRSFLEDPELEDLHPLREDGTRNYLWWTYESLDDLRPLFSA